jgi:hypothetical protein
LNNGLNLVPNLAKPQDITKKRLGLLAIFCK